MTEHSAKPLPFPKDAPEVSHEQIYWAIIALQGSVESVDRRLADGDTLFRSIEANLAICLRGLQVLLIEKASRMEVESSRGEVDGAIKRLEARDTESPPANDEPTNPGIRVPARESDPGDE